MNEQVNMRKPEYKRDLRAVKTALLATVVGAVSIIGQKTMLSHQGLEVIHC